MKRSLKLGLTVIVAMAIVLIAATPFLACTSICMGKAATVDGSVMTAHTCDGWYDARTFVVLGIEACRNRYIQGLLRPVACR